MVTRTRVCVCVYTYTHTYSHTYVHTYIHTYMFASVPPSLHPIHGWLTAPFCTIAAVVAARTLKTSGHWRYSGTHSSPRHYWEMSGQSPPLVPAEEEYQRTGQPVCTIWTRETCLASSGNRTAVSRLSGTNLVTVMTELPRLHSAGRANIRTVSWELNILTTSTFPCIHCIVSWLANQITDLLIGLYISWLVS